MIATIADKNIAMYFNGLIGLWGFDGCVSYIFCEDNDFCEYFRQIFVGNCSVETFFLL